MISEKQELKVSYKVVSDMSPFWANWMFENQAFVSVLF